MKRYFNLTTAVIAVALALAIAPAPRPRAGNTPTPTAHTRAGDECPAPDYYTCVQVEPDKYAWVCQCQHEGATHGPGAMQPCSPN